MTHGINKSVSTSFHRSKLIYLCLKSQSISAMTGRDVEAQAGGTKLRFIDVLAVTHWHSS